MYIKRQARPDYSGAYNKGAPAASGKRVGFKRNMLFFPTVS